MRAPSIFLLASLLAAACHAPPPAIVVTPAPTEAVAPVEPGPPMPETPLALRCGVFLGATDEDDQAFWQDARRGLRGAFDAALAGGPRAPLDILRGAPEAWTRRLVERAPGDRWDVDFDLACPEAAYPLGNGYAVPVVLSGSTAGGDWSHRYTSSNAWVVHTPEGWRAFASPPRDALASTRVVRQRGELWASAARQWIAVTADLDVEVDGRTLILELPPMQRLADRGETGTQNGFRLLEVLVDGRRVARDHVVLADDRLVVLGAPARAHVRVRYEGMPPLGRAMLEARTEELQLSDWLPGALVPARATTELVLHVPSDERFVSAFPLAAWSVRAGWLTYQGRFDARRAPTILVQKGFFRDRETIATLTSKRGTRIELDGFDDCGTGAPAFVDALEELAPLGPLRLVTSGMHGDFYGMWDHGLVLLEDHFGPRLCDPEDDESEAHLLVAHELAHAWFGGRVFEAVEGHASRWTEALAEYVATSRSERYGAEQRRDRLIEYARLSTEVPMTDQSPGFWWVSLSYGRGMLLMTALEDRVGRATMDAVLRDFLHANDGQEAGWDDIVASVEHVAGAAHATWLRTWLDRSGAPDLRLNAVRADGARVRGQLLQSASPPFEGDVELVFEAEDGTRRGKARVAFAAAVTTFDLELPAGTTRLRLDPDARLPRKLDPDRAPEDDGRAVDLSKDPCARVAPAIMRAACEASGSR
jgi:hypothetical protein